MPTRPVGTILPFAACCLSLAVLAMGACGGGAGADRGGRAGSDGSAAGAGGVADAAGVAGSDGAVGGGGGHADASADGLDRSRRLLDLTAAEWEVLCDSAPRPPGSDGGVVMCPGGGYSPVVNDPSSCRTYSTTLNPHCAATVGQSEDCTQALADHACDSSVAFATPACMATVGCDTTSCRNRCDDRCSASDAGSKAACLTSCFDATSGLSQLCVSCLVGSASGGCGAQTFASPADGCRTSCGAD